jgi:hypothetical protein
MLIQEWEMDVEENDISIDADGAILAAKAYRLRQPTPELRKPTFAVIAHPWGMLGGSMNDQ